MLILTDWGLFVRRSKTQLQSDGASPRVDSLFTSVCGMMVLKAEVKSKNSSFTLEFVEDVESIRAVRRAFCTPVAVLDALNATPHVAWVFRCEMTLYFFEYRWTLFS